MLKEGNKNIILDVSHIMGNMVTEIITHRKDVQVSLRNSEETRMLRSVTHA